MPFEIHKPNPYFEYKKDKNNFVSFYLSSDGNLIMETTTFDGYSLRTANIKIPKEEVLELKNNIIKLVEKKL